MTPPPAPSGLAAVSGNAQVTPTWSSVSGSSTYNIKRSTSSGGTYTTISSGSGLTWYNDASGLVNGTTYYYEVSTVQSGVEGANAGPVSATPSAPTAVPPAPTLVSLTPLDSKVNVVWSPVSGAAGYEVGYSTSSGGPYTWSSEKTSSPLFVTGLTNGTTYFFVVKALNSVGTGGNSNELSVTPEGVPPAPTLQGTPGNSQALLSWQSVSYATGFNLYRSTSSGGTYTRIGSLAMTGTTYTDSGLTNGNAYFYYVVAIDPAGNSSASNTVSVTPTALPSPPQAPVLSGTAGNAIVNLSWTAPTGATTYTLSRSSTKNGPYNTQIYSGPNTSAPDSNVTNGTTYYYTVVASNTGGSSGVSNEKAETPRFALVPSDIVPNPPLGFLPDAFTFPAWMESVVPTDSSDGPEGGPGSSISVNLAHGTADIDSGPDLVLDNPAGPGFAFERRYRTVLASGNLSSPGLPAGWTHSWDYRIVPLQPGIWGSLKLVYPNGTTETLTPALDGNGNPTTGALGSLPGAPYVASGVASTTVGVWSSITLRQNGLAQASFAMASGDTVYRLTTQTFANASVLNFHYSSGVLRSIDNAPSGGSASAGLTLNYGSAGYLSSVVDQVTGNTRTFSYSGSLLSSVSAINGTSADWSYQYTTFNGAPYLNAVMTPNPNGATATAGLTYDTGLTGRVLSTTDAVGNTRVPAYTDNGSTSVAIGRSSAQTDGFTSIFDPGGRQTGGKNAAGDTTSLTYGSLDPSVVTSVAPPVGNATTVATDSHGKPTQINHPYGNYEVIQWEYPADAPLGRVKSVTEHGNDGTVKHPTLASLPKLLRRTAAL